METIEQSTVDLKYPYVTTHFFQPEKNYAKIAQPGTGQEIYLTGDAREVWLYLESNEGLSTRELSNCITDKFPALTSSVVLDILKHLINLNLVLLEDPVDW